MELILKYFPNLSVKQKEQFEQLFEVYKEWNDQINVVSRKDFDSLYLKHVLHSLGIAKVIQFKPKTKILDVGCGGGFPGIPLAIMFPESNFHLVDSIGKKIKVVNGVKNAIGLKNVRGEHNRVENIKNQYDFVVSRAVTHMKDFLPWIKNKYNPKSFNYMKNGLFYLKGGDLSEELKGITHKSFDLESYFDEDFFETKKVIYIKA